MDADRADVSGCGRPRTICLRKVMDAILYTASSGCAWRMLPKCFPAISTVRGYLYAWRDTGLLTTINRIWREHPTPPDVVSTFVRAAMGDRVRWFYALTGQPCGSS